MANPKALVDFVKGLTEMPEVSATRSAKPPLEFITVRFKGGRSGILNKMHPHTSVWAAVIESQRQANLPVYVEIDAETNAINELHCPVTVKVGEITPNGDGEDVQVELIISHARHYLCKKHPDFSKLLDALKAANDKGTEVIVTETDDNEIIDVRPFTELEKGRRE